MKGKKELHLTDTKTGMSTSINFTDEQLCEIAEAQEKGDSQLLDDMTELIHKKLQELIRVQ